MKKLVFLYVCCFFCSWFEGISQVTSIADTSFRNLLISKYPQFMNSQGQLVDSIAAKYAGTLDCSSRSIVSLSGIQKFRKITSFICDHNQIVNIDSIKNLNTLTYISCNYNPVSKLPDLSKLTHLTTLAFAYTTLTAIPDLSKNTELVQIDCYGNKISTLPSLANLVNLEQLDASNNQLTSFPDLKNNLKLKTLNLQDNLIDSVPDIKNLQFLEIVNLSKNKIRSPFTISSGTDALKYLYLNDNQLAELPDMNLLKSLSILYVQNNLLDFKDLEPMLQLKSLSDFNYAPQGLVPVVSPAIRAEGSSFIFSTGLIQTNNSKTYSWYKDGAFIQKTSTDTLEIDQLKASDAGSYTCMATDSRLQSLSLATKPLTLTIYKCTALPAFVYKVVKYECNLGAKIIFDTNSVKVGIAPYKITLTSNKTNSVIYPKENVFSNVYENQYQIKVEDQYGCSGIQDVTFDNPRPADCTQQVIDTEDPEGANFLFIEEQGIARIFDKNGKLVRTLQAPVNWDGTIQSGALIPGFYVVEINNKQFHVTIIR